MIMKRFAIGILVGVLLMTGGTVLADEIQSYIGKQIEGQFPITIDNERIEQPGLVIEGVSYLPVRAAGELFGYEVSFIDSEVILRKNNSNDSERDVDKELEKGAEKMINEEEYTEEQLLEIIENIKTSIQSREVILEHELQSPNPRSSVIDSMNEKINSLKEVLAEREALLEQIRAAE